jgi:hypothetical protein
MRSESTRWEHPDIIIIMDENTAKNDERISSLLSSMSKLNASITEDTVKHYYHEDSDLYKCVREACGKPETKQTPHMTCGRCKASRYCSRECQIAHWKEHKATCKIISSNRPKPTKLMEDSNARMDVWKEKYKPLLQLATFWDLKGANPSDEMIIVVDLEDLPESCSFPRLGIKSFRQEKATDQEDFVQEFRSEMLEHAPDDCDRVEFALVCSTLANGEPTASMLPFAYDGEEDESLSAWSRLSPNAKNAFFHGEAMKYINTINEMAKGEKKELKKAARRVKK